MRIYVHQGGAPEPEAVEISETATLAEGFGIDGDDGTALWLEDADGELELLSSAADAGLAERCHVFRGPRRRIQVGVSYNGERRERDFGPGARVDRVFRWAVGTDGFDLDAEDAAEHTLAVAGSNAVPAGDVHIGSLDTERPGHLAFNLIPKHRYEG